jgi:prepilin-type N-terminal cleavage/methylation domain-containing protein
MRLMQRQTSPSDRPRHDGFTLIETLLVVAVGAVLVGMTVFAFQTAQRQVVSDSNMRLLASQLETARELAESQRRWVEIRFVGVNEIDTVRQELPMGSGETVLTRRFFENNVRFQTFAALPDTPDAFGNANPVDFGTAARVMFSPDGMLVDETYAPINGSVFIGVPGQTESARAVTVIGSTGRVRAYRWTGTAWGG